MKEIIYPEKKYKYEDKKCPNCKKKKLVWGQIPCPEGIEGCMVMHYGYQCHNCGKIFSN